MQLRSMFLVSAVIALPAFHREDASACAEEPAGIVSREFIFEDAPFPQCHASTIAEIPDGLIAAWFGGTREKHPDVGIWVSRRIGERWSTPVEVANGVQYRLTTGEVHRHPTWNPVLYRFPDGRLFLFYKCGPSPDHWWGMVTVSTNDGIDWAIPVRLPEHIDGPVRNKPLLLDDGMLLCGSSTEFDGWRVHFELTADPLKGFLRTPAINDGRSVGAIQPTLLRHRDGTIQALNRNQDGDGNILSTESMDRGRTWSPLKPISLPNPNSGIDAVTLKDGSFLLVYNHTRRTRGSIRGRAMLNIAVSSDGHAWKAAAVLEKEPGSEFSYPAVIQSTDGLVHVTYTWKRRRIRHVTVDPKKLQPRSFDGEEWPE